MSNDVTRRRFVAAAGLAAATGALAGCSTETRSEATTAAETTEQDTTTAAPTTESGGSGGDVPTEVSDYLSDVGNFDGSLTDATGQDTVTVAVGAEGNGGAFAFDPPAVAVSTGTTVQWKWTGNGGAHNVVAKDGTFDSGETVSAAGVNFEYTFENTGVFTYFCEPHKTLGMKGAIVVQ